MKLPPPKLRGSCARARSFGHGWTAGRLFGRDWTDARLCLPWADCRSWMRYAVLCPAYCGDILICHFRWDVHHGVEQWWHEPLGLGIAGVTHWRLAGDDEYDYWLDSEQWPAPGAISIDFAAQRWNWLHIDGPFEILDY